MSVERMTLRSAIAHLQTKHYLCRINPGKPNLLETERKGFAPKFGDRRPKSIRIDKDGTVSARQVKTRMKEH